MFIILYLCKNIVLQSEYGITYMIISILYLCKNIVLQNLNLKKRLF